jgi:cell division protein FtsX
MTPLAPRDGGAALFWVVAIACLLAAVAGLAARLADRAAADWDDALRGALTARVLAPDTPEALDGAARTLGDMPGVETVRVVTPARAAALLRNWGGPAIPAENLPALRVIEFKAQAAPTPAWTSTVEHGLVAAGYEAKVYGPGPALREAAGEAHALAEFAVIAGAVLGVAALFTAGLAGRARAASDYAIVAPMADAGATRGQVSGAFAGRAALEGFMAGLVGAFAATLISAWLLSLDTPGLPFSDWAQRVEIIDGAPLIAAPLLAALLAGAGARTAADRLYRRAARRA